MTTTQREKDYEDRAARVADAVALKEPDRVPIVPVIEHFPWYYAGSTVGEVMYDFSKAQAAMDLFYADFKPDMGFGTIFAFPGKFMEMAGIRWLRWPGYGIDDVNAPYQFIEGEYMTADEYDELIFDPTGFMMNKWLPRCFSSAKGLRHMTFRGAMWFGFVGSFAAFLDPELRETLRAMQAASDELTNWFTSVGGYTQRMREKFGIPCAYGGFGFAPFDMLGDTLRGTVSILQDMYERPDKLLAALDKLCAIAIEDAVGACRLSGTPYVWIWLHKGLDEFMSDAMYRKFYWPTLQRYLIGLIDEGITPVVYAEGSYNTRLEILRDVPRGKVVYDFETVDMRRAKKILGDTACIAGNIPNSLLAYGDPDEVETCCKRLIDDCAGGGGFIMDASALIDNAKPENIEMMFRATRKYGCH